jgi:PIN domain nuclease of toxin-antitoxin system
MNHPLLLDTCATIWILDNAPMADAAIAAIDEAFDGGIGLYVSPMTAWEIGRLISRGRLKSVLPPQRWFRRILEVPGVRLADMSPEVLIASSLLPGSPLRDPTDRILAATAREYDYALVTRDPLLLSYAHAHEGHLLVLEC